MSRRRVAGHGTRSRPRPRTRGARGWVDDTGLAARSILEPIASPESLLGLGVFTVASVALGRLLELRHVAIALLAAMLWAAGVHAALSLVGNGTLAENPVGVVAAALVAVGVEFGLRRTHDEEPGLARADTERDLGRHRLSGRLA